MFNLIKNTRKINSVRNLTSSVYNIEKLKLHKHEENIVLGGKDKYNLLDKGLEGIKQIGIIGWGSQAPAQYQNINDSLRSINSNIDLKIGLRENSSSYLDALNTKGVNECNIGEMYEVLEQSDMNIILISDAAQCENYEKIFSAVRPGTTLGFSHGFILGHLKNEKKYFPEDINVVMMAPKGMGPSLRKLYLQDKGINSSIAVEQDIDNRATDRVISWAIASGSPYVFETTMEKEYISDLFGERAILLGGIHGMVEYLYKMFNQKFTKEEAYILACRNLTNNINEKISKKGLFNVYKNMSYGDKMIFNEYYNIGYDNCKELFREIYEEVKNGNEIRDVIQNGNMEMDKIDGSEMWEVGKKLRNNDFRDYKNKSKFSLSSNVHLIDEYYYMYHINPKTAGLYVGGIMAQIDILLENGHSISEIVNESIIEATDSLNPYMEEKGITHMIDNCSTTARLGARKWGPKLEELLEENKSKPVKNEIRNFVHHNIHTEINILYNYK